jgi:hypothetical protein
LPMLASQTAPVAASIAATMEAASGSPPPPAVGQYRSGFVVMRRARLWTRIASKAVQQDPSHGVGLAGLWQLRKVSGSARVSQSGGDLLRFSEQFGQPRLVPAPPRHQGLDAATDARQMGQFLAVVHPTLPGHGAVAVQPGESRCHASFGVVGRRQPDRAEVAGPVPAARGAGLRRPERERPPEAGHRRRTPCRLLKIAKGSPLLYIDEDDHDASGRAVMVSAEWHVPDIFEMHVNRRIVSMGNQ